MTSIRRSAGPVVPQYPTTPAVENLATTASPITEATEVAGSVSVDTAGETARDGQETSSVNHEQSRATGGDSTLVSGAVQGAYSRQKGKQELAALGVRLTNIDVPVNPFGKAASDMAQIPDDATTADLHALLQSEWPKVSDHNEASARETSWLVTLANQPQADAALRLDIAARLGELKLHSVALQRGALLFIKQLKKHPDAEEIQLNTWSFGAPSSSHPAPSPVARESDLLQSVAQFFRTANPVLDSRDLAYLDTLADHPAADKDFAAAVITGLGGRGITAEARKRGAIPFLLSQLQKTEMGSTVEENGAPDLGTPDPSLPAIPADAKANGLLALFEGVQSKIRRGGWISRKEAAWMLALVSQPGADRRLGERILDTLVQGRATSDLKEDHHQLVQYLKHKVPELPSVDITPPPLPDLGMPASKLDPLPAASASLDELKTLLAQNQHRIGRGGNWLNPNEAAWLIKLADHPSADAELGQNILAFAQSLKPTRKAQKRMLRSHLLALQSRVFSKGAPVNLASTANTLAAVRDRMVRAAGSDQILTRAELAAEIEPLNAAEQRAINNLYDSLNQAVGGGSLTVPVILSATDRAMRELTAADVNGDLKLDRQEMVGLLALNASVIDLSLTLGANQSSAGTAFRELDYSNLSGQQLRDAIRDRAGFHLVLSYRQARQEMFSKIDNANGKVTGVYTGRKLTTDGIPVADGPDGMNTEHTRPKSKGVKGTDALSDLHHLFPTDSSTNNRRASYPFGIVKQVTWQKAGAKLGKDENGHTVFEPPPEHRGNVARSLFYVSAVYGLPISAEEEAILRSWHIADPVDASEIKRNDMIEDAQGNRNPFIDNPDLANKLDDF